MNQADLVDQAIISRKSVRAYLDKPVDKSIITDILQVAARAPSGNNIQPWNVIALSGKVKNSLSQAIISEIHSALANNKFSLQNYPYEFDYYPQEWIEPFISRRRKVGFDLFQKAGIARDDKVGRQKLYEDNFWFFRAPVGLLFLMNRIHNQGALIDIGGFIQNVSIAARARGLDTCPQAIFSSMHKIIYQHLNIEKDMMLICGMALGYSNSNHPVNQLTTERVPVTEFTRFAGFN